MAITGKLIGANVALSPQGMTMAASVELVDDVLGTVGQRGIAVADPAVVAQVQGYIESMLPTLSAAAGFPVTVPVAPVVETPPAPTE